MTIHLGRPLPDASRDRPGRRRGNSPDPQKGLPSLLGLAPGGVYIATAVAGGAVRSYRTLSPLPRGPQIGCLARRFAFCCTFPRVAPAGRYPAPCFRGARTFLPAEAPKEAHRAVIQPSGSLELRPIACQVKCASGQAAAAGRPGDLRFPDPACRSSVLAGNVAERQ